MRATTGRASAGAERTHRAPDRRGGARRLRRAGAGRAGHRRVRAGGGGRARDLLQPLRERRGAAPRHVGVDDARGGPVHRGGDGRYRRSHAAARRRAAPVLRARAARPGVVPVRGTGLEGRRPRAAGPRPRRGHPPRALPRARPRGGAGPAVRRDSRGAASHRRGPRAALVRRPDGGDVPAGAARGPAPHRRGACPRAAGAPGASLGSVSIPPLAMAATRWHTSSGMPAAQGVAR